MGIIGETLWWLFPPPQVRATRRHVREILRRISPTYPLPAELRRRALRLALDDAGYVVRAIRDEGQTPDQVALGLVASTAIGLLVSGHYRIVRGVLTGQGHALMSALTYCTSELERRGHPVEPVALEVLRRLRQETGRQR